MLPVRCVPAVGGPEGEFGVPSKTVSSSARVPLVEACHRDGECRRVAAPWGVVVVAEKVTIDRELDADITALGGRSAQVERDIGCPFVQPIHAVLVAADRSIPVVLTSAYRQRCDIGAIGD